LILYAISTIFQKTLNKGYGVLLNPHSPPSGSITTISHTNPQPQIKKAKYFIILELTIHEGDVNTDIQIKARIQA